MKYNYIGIMLAGALLLPLSTQAEEMSDSSSPAGWQRTIILAHEISEFSIPLASDPDFFVQEKEYFYRGQKILLPDDSSCELDENGEKILPFNPEIRYKWSLNPDRVNSFLQEHVIPHIDREPESVRIFRNENGEVAFEGVANFGKKIDVSQAVFAIEKALEAGVDRVQLPVTITKPEVVVEAEDLKGMGVTELLSVGESDFSGSTWSRIHNVEVGAAKFDGFLISQGEVGSFNDRLGPVTGAEGYLPELVILGPKLEKEYGGGLCQVSSTAFRAALLAGLPIVERYPHSFAVHYYEPWGTDATIYPGAKDMRFKNDTDGAILVQTSVDVPNRILRFHFYGTKDDREVVMFGPHIGYRSGPLTSRPHSAYPNQPGIIKYTSKASGGFDATWLRVILPDEQKAVASEVEPQQDGVISTFFSRYQPSVNWSTKPEPKPEPEPEVPAQGSTI